MASNPNYYWLGHKRYIEARRIRWHGEPAEESFWFDYWKHLVTPAYFRRAESIDLAKDELGRILLDEMNADGVHLEAGCGAGYWVAALRQNRLNTIGIEYSRDLVKMVKDIYPQLPVSYGDALAIDCPGETFTSYLSFGVVEHRIEGPEPFLLEAFRVLIPGGKLIVTVPHLGPVRQAMFHLGRYSSTPPQEPFFQYGFSISEFSELVRKSGFIVDYTCPLYIHRLLLEEIGLFRWLSNRRGSGYWRPFVNRIFRRMDGHMLLCVGHKPLTTPISNKAK
ncbi:MAG: class I SAM-dependent methyltransferase [Chloroflexota bacterium]|jgi:SAM-dependent methyltransferase